MVCLEFGYDCNPVYFITSSRKSCQLVPAFTPIIILKLWWAIQGSCWQCTCWSELFPCWWEICKKDSRHYIQTYRGIACRWYENCCRWSREHASDDRTVECIYRRRKSFTWRVDLSSCSFADIFNKYRLNYII